MALWVPIASIVTIHPSRARSFKSSGMAVISLDFSFTATWASTIRFSTSPGTDHMERFFFVGPVMRASQGLSIDGDHPADFLIDALHPHQKTGFKLLGIDPCKNTRHRYHVREYHWVTLKRF